MKVAITGHRPEDIGVAERWVKEQLATVFMELMPTQVFVGMAAGVDLWAADVALTLGFPIVACKPWAGHYPRVADRELYLKVWDEAAEQVNVSDSETYTSPQLYHARNHYMVDNSDVVIAVWGGKTSGGTYQCLKYAKQHNKPYIVIDPTKRVVDMVNFNHGLF